jgi:ABC-type dipeptide/oligopeptide/nickel transport systems, permease components
MFKYILSRIGAMLLTLFLIMSLAFMVVRLMPLSLFENPETDPEIQRKLEDKYHLNDPIPVQYFYFMKDIITDLNFGISVKIRPGLDVFNILISRLPPTILINFISLFISIPLGLIFGTIAALNRNTWIDHVISVLVIIFISVPSFIFGAVLQYTLTFAWPVFPTLYDSQAVTFAQKMHSLFLPIVALSLNPTATIARYLRGELIENISSEYLLLARTKGLTKAQAIVRHAFRNSLIPISNTLIGMITGIMGGSLVIEKMFAIPGEGGLLVKSIFAGDHFLTVAVLIFYSAVSLVTILIVDLSYGIIDPRVRVGGGKA